MPKNLDLVLDTSRMGISLGIYSAGVPLYEFYEPKTRGENLGHALDVALEKAKVTLDDITRVLVTLGPGSFTGLRTGIAFCEGLCFSGRRHLYGISTLKALTSLSSDASSAVVLPARTGFWYVGLPSGEHFLLIEDALAKFDAENVRSFVVDPSIAEEANFKTFVDKVKGSVALASGENIHLFCKFFDELTPNIIQKANYIQPSYYERIKK
ncbi:MAG: tRNA (adenosine(37)-N6)-threonylcarbamoyltransferase complex dimerization subunit type 1 TsaB [Fibrobacteraceae bacterium]|nr:tRNA (adenosine(37)-N6)-threonylcarbamoyltransferase complex dimerization subunit type 1 TsaB [Fibrobacteraceae bacterium]